MAMEGDVGLKREGKKPELDRDQNGVLVKDLTETTSIIARQYANAIINFPLDRLELNSELNVSCSETQGWLPGFILLINRVCALGYFLQKKRPRLERNGCFSLRRRVLQVDSDVVSAGISFSQI